MRYFEEIGEGMLLIAEGQVEIARALAKAFGRLGRLFRRTSGRTVPHMAESGAASARVGSRAEG